MIRRGAVLLGVATLASGCVYYNSIYNAEHVFDQGEKAYWAGHDSAAAVSYEEALQKAAAGYRKEPNGDWAEDALYLVGLAHFRRGRLRAARAALQQVADEARDSTTRLDALAYLGAIRVRTGDPSAAVPLLNRALEGVRQGPVSAEAHLWRARALLESGRRDEGWWDLDRVGDADRRLRVAAALERLRWATRVGDHLRVREAVARLLTYPEAGVQSDSIIALLSVAAGRWGDADAAELLAHAEGAAWERTDRGKIRLERARLLMSAGDSATAEAEARSVAGGIGRSAVSARIQIARWRFARATSLADARDAATVLVPAEEDSAVAPILSSLDEVSDLASMGSEDPLALFAAGEVARDSLGAARVAARLFLAYADAAPDDPWAPKALLAALALSPDEGTRAWLRGRLEGRSLSPYVRAARGEPSPGFEALEEELSERLSAVRSRLAAVDSVAHR